jgi:hypothetical protein
MKIKTTVIIIGISIPVVIAELTRFNILRQLGMGIPVSEYELRLSDFLQSLAFTPIGLGVGVATLLFSHNVILWYDRLLGWKRSVYPPGEYLALRFVGIIFIIATIAGLWTTGQLLFQ